MEWAILVVGFGIGVMIAYAPWDLSLRLFLAAATAWVTAAIFGLVYGAA
jgi:hypothetical protein